MRGTVAKFRRWLRFNLLYERRPPWDTGVSPPELIELLETLKPGHALDVGCGTGTNLITMAAYGWDVVGADLAWLPVLKARQKIKKINRNSRVFHADVTGKTGIKGTFGLVLDIGCYHSLSPLQRANYRRNLMNWLGKDGIYLLYAHKCIQPCDGHGITKEDIDSFQEFIMLTWLREGAEVRPDGGGGQPAARLRFDRN